MKGVGDKVRIQGGWKDGRSATKGRGVEDERRQHFRGGKPRGTGKEGETMRNGRLATVYGVGVEESNRRLRMVGVSHRAKRSKVARVSRGNIEQRVRRRGRGADKQRREREGRQLEVGLGTVRGKRIARGLPVNGQRTRSNGKTARVLNKKRG